MPKTELKNINGEKLKDLKLNEKIFGIEPNNAVIYDAVVLNRASARQGSHKVKNRSEVSGGGRKPWRQKGTGNARQGSIRSPQWKGGGTVFGPQPNQNYNKKQNKKERRLAILSALSYKAQENAYVLVDKINLESPKTKDLLNILKNLKIEKSVLIITNDLSDNIILASRNVSGVKVITPTEINTYDILLYNDIIITEEALKTIEEVLTNE